MSDQPLTPASEAHTADSEDGGWSVESASASIAAPPDDTTAAAVAAEVAAVADGTVTDDDATASESESQPEKPAASAPAGTAGTTTPAASGAKKKQSAQARIDQAIASQRAAERRETASRKEADDLRRRIEALERKPVEPPAAGGKPAVPAPDEMPAHPKYPDYDTEEAYQADVAKWHKDVLAWQTRREDKFKTDITSGLDERLKTERANAEQMAHEASVAARIRGIKETHPDFDELLAANAEVYAGITSQTQPFIFDIIENTADGAEFFYDLAASPEMATALRDLPVPTRALAHAVKRSPAPRALMKHFATDEGREDFMRLRSMPDPGTVFLSVGALHTSLTSAARGPASAVVHPITHAAPPAKPPAGTPRARESQPGLGVPSFEAWMAEEDKKEEAERKRMFGLAPA